MVMRQGAQYDFNPDENFHFSFTRKHLNKTCHLPSLFRKSIGINTSADIIGVRDEGQRIQKYVELLMPLLFETWMEVRPAKLNTIQTSNDFDENDLLITNEAAFTLKIILEIVDQLLELMQMYDRDVNNDDLIEWFRKKYGNEFCAQFLRGFPYQQADGFKGMHWLKLFLFCVCVCVTSALIILHIAGSKRKSKGSATEQEVFEAGGQRCIEQNLNISYIFWMLNNKSVNSLTWGKKLIAYMKGNIN